MPQSCASSADRVLSTSVSTQVGLSLFASCLGVAFSETHERPRQGLICSVTMVTVPRSSGKAVWIPLDSLKYHTGV